MSNRIDLTADGFEEQEPAQNVEDPGEFNQRLRLQEIGQARMTARKALSGEAQQAYGNQWEAVAFREVQNFAREIEWLVRNRSSKEYFTQPLGPVEIGPPTREDFPDNITTEKIIGEEPRSKQVPVTGLFTTEDTGRGFVDLPTTVSQSWTVSVGTRHSGPQQITVTLQRSMPISVTDQANSLCRKFINEVGLDARLEDQVDEDPNPV